MDAVKDVLWFLTGAGFVGALALVGFAHWIELVVF